MTSVGALARVVLCGPPRLGAVRLVCVDGPAGSGKTTLAAAVADALGRAAAPRAAITVATMHLDDLYEGWSGLDRGLTERLMTQVLEPLAQGEAARYQRYDWERGAFGEWHEVPVPDVLVLEGCGSGQRAVAEHASLLAWVEVPADLRLDRGLARDGEHMRDEWLRWMGLEAVQFAQEGTRARADVVLDGTAKLLP